MKSSFCARIVAGAALLLVASCATTSLTRQDVLRQYDAVAALSDGLQAAQGRDGALLAPGLFKQTKEHLDRAFEHARRAKKNRAIAAANRGLKSLERLDQAIRKGARVMREVLDMRTRAVDEGAAVLFKDGLQEADEAFQSASRRLERGDTQEARTRRAGLIDRYAKLELAALKKGKTEAARKAIADATAGDAEDYAPKTLKKAEEELKLAVAVLDADRTQRNKADQHAREATWHARRAAEITALLKYYESQDFSKEDVALWYQAQLQQIRRALRKDRLPFDQPNSQVIVALQSDTRALQSVLADMKKTNRLTRQQIRSLESELDTTRAAHSEKLNKVLAQHRQQLEAIQSGNAQQLAKAQREAKKQIAALESTLSARAQAQAEEKRRKRRAEARFRSVESMFSKAEAEVFRKGDNVLVRLKGFGFKPGKSEIESDNYGLLNKVVAAINTFPNSVAEISGHTDSRGSDKRNLELSAARAQSVVKFLTTVGGVATSRLTSEGKGEAEPVASNETPEGRAKNRRIDVLIRTGGHPAPPVM